LKGETHVYLWLLFEESVRSQDARTETGTTDDLGIRYEGPVLNGLAGVKQALQLAGQNSPQTAAQLRELNPAGLKFAEPPHFLPSVAAAGVDYDPVLRHHLNLPPRR
jgi:hypothetical protein